jgi:hypothetical protein
MFKPTKPQHIVNKKYVDENSGGGSSDSFDPFIINVVSKTEPPDEESSTWMYDIVIDKTKDQILDAVNSGKKILMFDESIPLSIEKVGEHGDINAFSFYDETPNLYIHKYEIYEDSPDGASGIMVSRHIKYAN